MPIAYAGARVPDHMVTVALELPGHCIVQNVGVVRGIVVRSRSAIGNLAARFQAIIGGNISVYAQLCERSRQDAYELCLAHASEAGGNAIIGMRYEANEVGPGITEVLCYGTAVVVEPVSPEHATGMRTPTFKSL